MNRHDFNNKIMIAVHKSGLEIEFGQDEMAGTQWCYFDDPALEKGFRWNDVVIAVLGIGKESKLRIVFTDVEDVYGEKGKVGLKFTDGRCEFTEEYGKMWLSCFVLTMM